MNQYGGTRSSLGSPTTPPARLRARWPLAVGGSGTPVVPGPLRTGVLVAVAMALLERLCAAVGSALVALVALVALTPVCSDAAAGTAPRAVAVGVTDSGDRLVFEYTLEGTGPARVRLRGLTDDGLVMRTLAVEGDVGEGVAPGPDRRFSWLYPRDYPEGWGDREVSLSVFTEPVGGAELAFLPVRGIFGIGVTVELFRECLEAAGGSRARVVVAEIDSPGGDPVVAEDAVALLQGWRKDHPDALAVAYVVGEAAGAAALFALAFDALYLAPGATIGGDTPPEDAELLPGVNLEPPPRLRFNAKRWAEARGIPIEVREALVARGGGTRLGAREALERGVAAGLPSRAAELGALLGYSTWSDGSRAAREAASRSADRLKRGLSSYDSLAAMIDEGLRELAEAPSAQAASVARGILRLADEAAYLQGDLPFTEALFAKEFPGGLEGVRSACAEALAQGRQAAQTVARTYFVRRIKRRS